MAAPLDKVLSQIPSSPTAFCFKTSEVQSTGSQNSKYIRNTIDHGGKQI